MSPEWTKPRDENPDGLNQKFINMKSKKVYFHVLEYGDYGNIGYHDYYLTLEEAQNRVNDLSEMFPEVSFQVFTSTSKKEPPITTV